MFTSHVQDRNFVRLSANYRQRLALKLNCYSCTAKPKHKNYMRFGRIFLGAHLGRGSCGVQWTHGRVSSCLTWVSYILIYM
jgi:hypothetical protein